jgi:hypothetical protein
VPLICSAVQAVLPRLVTSGIDVKLGVDIDPAANIHIQQTTKQDS